VGTERTGVTECVLCGREQSGPGTESTAGEFCSEGCREVYTTLDGDGVETEPEHVGDRSGTPEEGGLDPDTRDSFFRVDGMHNGTCEGFLESVAEGRDGVVEASASYVTETVRVEYDPERVDRSELREALTTVGYTATPREEAEPFDRGATGADATVDRGIDDLLGLRYVAGVVFASFLLFPYLLFLYPTYLSKVLDVAVLDAFAGGTGFGSGGALLLLPTFVALTSVVVFFTGLPLLRGAYVSLRTREPTTDLLVSVTLVGAFLYSVVSMLAGGPVVYFDLAVVVAAVVVAVAVHEATTKREARDRLAEVTGGRVRTADRYEGDGTIVEVDVEDLAPGDEVLVREGERVPVDGVVAEGECTVEEAVMTGEPLPVLKSAGDSVVGGSVVTDDAAVVAVGDDAESSIERLSTAVWGIQSADHGVQRAANRLAAVAIPTVVLAALAVGLGSFLLGWTPTGAVLAVLSTLVVATPWVLGVATPLSVASSIRDALEAGVVVFDETTFERLREVDTVVFDKTGTLTAGEMEVLSADAPANLLSAAAALERRATHPAAEAVVDAYGSVDSGGEEAGREVTDFETHSTGVQGTVDGTELLVGNRSLFADRGWDLDEETERAATAARESGHLPVILGRSGASAGLVVVGDRPRDNWEDALGELRAAGTETIVLTGDDGAGEGTFADSDAVDRVFAGVPPSGKAAAIRRLRRTGNVAMVGDGTNDAPALAAADLGIVLDGGTALASEAADLAIVEDDLDAVGRAFEIARAAGRRVRQNNWLAFTYNGAAAVFAVAGVLLPPLVMAGAAGSCLLVWANSSRSLSG
jgi:heavy metal translocating P-type ATPase